MTIELAYFPPVQHFQHFSRATEIWIEQCENYQKNSCRNRCHIATANGLLRLTVPLQKGKHESQPVRDVRIAYDLAWQRQHAQSIVCAYSKAPFFEDYWHEIQPFFEKKYDFLFDFNWAILTKMHQLLSLETPFFLTEKFSPPAAISGAAFRPYPQVFEDRHGFLPNLSVLDLLFCLGSDWRSGV